jgi:hypothetical protein
MIWDFGHYVALDCFRGCRYITQATTADFARLNDMSHRPDPQSDAFDFRAIIRDVYEEDESRSVDDIAAEVLTRIAEHRDEVLTAFLLDAVKYELGPGRLDSILDSI